MHIQVAARVISLAVSDLILHTKNCVFLAKIDRINDDGILRASS